MQEEKTKKILKIVAWALFILAIIAIIVMCIVSAVIKQDAQSIQDDNQQIEDILGEEEEASILLNLK